VLWALEEMGLPYEIVGMDHPNHDLDRDDFRAKNPFGLRRGARHDGVVRRHQWRQGRQAARVAAAWADMRTS
jgi:hypothetical protein